MLFHIRKSLGKNAIHTRGTEEISINYDVITCDALEFRNAIDDKSWEKAVKYYKGKLLDGFFVNDAANDMEHWLDREREYFQREYLRAVEHLARQADQNELFDKSAYWWEKWNSEDPFDTSKAEKWVVALAKSGKKTRALRAAENHAYLLAKEMGEDAKKIIKRLRSGIELGYESYIKNPTEMHPESQNVKAIAVLPFEEIGTSPSVSNFANGLHHDLLSRLAVIAGLKVISRTSVLRYKDGQSTIKQISEDLNADYIVEGAIQESGGLMRLHVQVIDAKSEGHHTAISYNTGFSGDKIFDVQTELASKISHRLKEELTPTEVKQLKNTPTHNLEAYLLYTEGRTHLNHRTEKSLALSIRNFLNSIKNDNQYAQAWAGLAEALTLAAWYNYNVPETNVSAMEAAVKALSLNPELGEAHASMGILLTRLLNGPEAKRELETAVRLQPSFAEAFSWLGWLLAIIGELDRAIGVSERSVKLDPYSTYTRAYLSVIYLAAGKYDEALEEIHAARTIEPEYGVSYYVEGLILYHLKQYEKSEIALRESMKLLNPQGALAKEDVECVLALVFQKQGRTAEMRRLHEQFKKKKEYVFSGLLYASMNQTDKAFDEFLKLVKWKAFPAVTIRYFYPDMLREIRNDKRYREIIKDVKRSWNLQDQEE
ncbi:BTAD domain-containing putative transcriptional regulator [Rhodohalobacter mucosus]|nr:tetratricopeptide repeat protein [Rhodohalobacter mucosus]